MNESCHTYEWVMSHIWMSHVTHMNESCHIYMNESCHTYEWVSSQKWNMAHRDIITPQSAMSHGTHMHDPWRTYARVISHAWMSHITHMNESQESHHTNEKWQIAMFSLRSLQWVMAHTRMRDVTYEYVISKALMSHNTRMNESYYMHEWVISYTWMSHVTRVN